MNIMNAIINNNQTYKVTSERGDFWITEDIKGKVKMFAKKDVEVVEVSEMPKAKIYKQMKATPEQSKREHEAYKKRLAIAEYFEHKN